MKSMKIHRSETGLFSEQHLKMVYEQEFYKDFIQQPFSSEAFQGQLELKSQQFTTEQRTVLKNAILNQYSNLPVNSTNSWNITSLTEENTFTITTGHQLSLFTGPLYFIVKILHVIKMCEVLKEKYPENHFVPVYWMATEDHDFEEIQSANLFNQTVTWETDQKGPVGRFDMDGFDEAKQKFLEFFSNEEASEVHGVLNGVEGSNYTEVMQSLVNSMFGGKGLIIVDGDDPALKKLFVPVIKKELTEQFSYASVLETNQKLSSIGGKLQVSPREINLFYIEKGIRERIVEEDGTYKVNGVGEFSQDEILAMVDEHPERFSPNVILRPLYQEIILPNLCYVGGAGEISYWLQLKGVFDSMGVLYPLIQVRNSVLWMEKAVAGKLEKFDFNVTDVFKDVDAWKKEYVQANAGDELDFSELDKEFESFKSTLKASILSVDTKAEQYADSEIARLNKQIEGVKSKAVKKSKAKHEQVMKAMDVIKSRLFPGNGLQERHTNFFQFCADGQIESHTNDLSKALDPFSGDLILLIDSQS